MLADACDHAVTLRCQLDNACDQRAVYGSRPGRTARVGRQA
jgi:hypothetical protein